MTSNTREALAAELEGIASLLGRNQLTQRGTASRKIRQAAAALRAPVSVSPSPSADREALFEAIRSNVFATVYENVGGISDAVDAILALSPARSAGNQSGASVEPSTLAASVMTTDAASRRGEPDYDICGYRDSSDTYSVAVTERGALEACKNYLQPKAKWKDGANYFMENEESRLLAKVDAALRRTVAETGEPVAWRWKDLRWQKTYDDSAWIYLTHEPMYSDIIKEALYAAPSTLDKWLAPASPAAPSPAVEREALLDALDRVIGHDPNAPSLSYPTVKLLLESAAGAARDLRAALAQPATAGEKT